MNSHSHYMVKIGHSPGCNALKYEDAIRAAGIQMHYGRNYKVAACVVCQDSQGKYFLTRRERNMGFFPKAWVFPGGHIDAGEGLDEGGLRELYEETGLEITVNRNRGNS